MTKACIFTILILSITTTVWAEEQWPSDAQTKLVEQRQATFPWQNLVSEVDWYEPLEVVPGSGDGQIPQILATKDTYKAAEQLAADQESYALLIWQQGALRYEHYWPGFNASSRYDTASMHKTVVALLMGAAVADGYVKNIDQPLGDYVENVIPAALGEVSLRSLMEMSSGMGSPPFSSSSVSVGMQTYLGNDLRQAYNHWSMDHKANEEFYYSNVNPQYLGWVIEQATGKRYAEYLSERIWQPLGNNDARVWLDKPGGTPRTSCCLQASARDWLRVGLLIMNEGKVDDKQIIPADWIQQMVQPSPLNPNYGWLIWRGSPHNPNRKYSQDSPFSVPAKAPFKASDVYYLDGSGAQRVYIVPSQQTVIVRIGKPSQTWDDSALPNLILNESE